MILSYIQAREMFSSLHKSEFEISLDLGISKSKVKIENDHIVFPNGQRLESSKLKKIIKDDTVCFTVIDNSLVKVHLFSDETNKYYKLVPTRDWPTIEISGIRMHATKNMTPKEDTEKKLESIGGVNGIILDTCMGLGYTAILASKQAELVFTCEKDENVIEIGKYNPYSRELFNNKKISIINTSSFKQIKNFKSSMFDVVIHDPPRVSLASELYSSEFYSQVFRVLKKNGKFYHYTGNPGSKNRNINLPGNVSKKLRSIGFIEIENVHYGIAARK